MVFYFTEPISDPSVHIDGLYVNDEVAIYIDSQGRYT